MTTPATLSICGAGKLGRTLARLWQESGQFRIGQVFCSSLTSARDAVAFIGAGEPCGEETMPEPADLWLIATPDGAIAEAARRLGPALCASSVVFHCSGSLASSAMALQGCHTASVHPVHSFADPARSIGAFAGSYCTAEGDVEALERLLPAFRAIGGEPLTIDSHAKSLYHASTVMACNYLVTLMDSSYRCLAAAGIDGQQARQLLAPLASQTLQNCLGGDTSEALTGPIARRDLGTVAAHLQALAELPALQELYRALGRETLTVAGRQPHGQSLQPLASLLGSSTTPPDHTDDK
ncbi:Rossmann-like and DUF2520 domain-containing protein [Pseudomaricurvus sp. HS19]|uniref:Rossmann-like and DUF2520 domain-containing protein n=1 Tax=Pseudomaricurvus sp. HS19 TaxID=2692626 RepID=UPI00136964AF|nr:Rossmann-like and DUF2520 domain-containing protein [Pseudomaricurvus sp. HS19]MYM62665.1 DUF2520 domain-containing protein [Pseudomaricurvus sp. HS19]